MKKETELRFFSYIIHEDRSILDFLTAKYTFLNEPLAKLYGIPNVKGDEFRQSGPDRHGSGGCADAGECVDGLVVSDADVAGDSR